MKLIIQIPCLNEEKTLPLVLKSIPKKITGISWQNFRKIVGSKWTPGLSKPFDPIASKLAAEVGIKVIIMNGKKLINLEKCLAGKKFQGTVIE